MEIGMPARQANEKTPRVVIVGAGFGGLSLAKGLARAPYDVTLIDRHNYHLFQPLLYQVATAALSPADIAAPIRAILRGQANVTVVLADVSGVDVAAKEVIAEGKRIPYDILVLATGAQHAYFGHDDWARVRARPEDDRRCDLLAPAASCWRSNVPRRRAMPRSARGF